MVSGLNVTTPRPEFVAMTNSPKYGGEAPFAFLPATPPPSKADLIEGVPDRSAFGLFA